MAKKEKLAIIASGGAMRCVWGAGVLAALAEHYNLKEPDFVIGGSGSAGALAYYTSGQTKSLREVWTRHLFGTKFINLKRFWRIMDVDYLVDYICKKIYPLNLKKFYSSKTKCLLAATDYDSGDVKFFENNKEADVYEILRATKALPLVYSKLVPINGRRYLDTNLSAWIRLHAKEAVERGATKLIIIDNHSTGKLQQVLHHAWARMRRKVFKKRYVSQLRELQKYKIPKHIKTCVIEATGLDIAPLTRNPILLEKAFDKGYMDAVKHPELRSFLKN